MPNRTHARPAADPPGDVVLVGADLIGTVTELPPAECPSSCATPSAVRLAEAADLLGPVAR